MLCYMLCYLFKSGIKANCLAGRVLNTIFVWRISIGFLIYYYLCMVEWTKEAHELHALLDDA
jgi:hypothetical protein